MTVSYTGDVANGSSFGCFWKILHRWKGSVYKLIWRELIAYLVMYFVINACYRMGMDDNQKRTFEKVKVYCSKQIESIPMSFVLGFYVSLIVKRWWDQYWILPLPDSLALYIGASINGQDERGRILRRTIIRYAMLSYIITLQRISFRVKKRFPTLQHLVDTGLMMDREKKIFDTLDAKSNVCKFWLPVIWASNLVNRAKLEGRIQSDHMLQTILMELSDFRRRLGRVMVYDNVSVPLVYTQVVTLAVYTYFIAALVGRQWVNPPQPWRTRIYPGYELDLYFPIFLSLQFIFYIGWLKVAETLINPFGEDDDDFELNWLIDRHIQVSFMVVDEMHEEHPELLKDPYWEEVVPIDLPYNIASEQFRRPEPKGSTASMKIKEKESVYANLASVKRHSVIADDADYASVADSPLAGNRKTWIQRQLSRVESFRSTSSSSSLFIRTRSQNKQNGHLPTSTFTPNNSGLHRLSLYDRLMNRRSSKEQGARNSPKIPPSANPSRAMNGTVSTGKDHLNTLVPHPLLRPRVPTPDVTKENQLHLFAANTSEKPLSTRNFNQTNNNNSTNNNNNNNNMSANALSVQGHNIANSANHINNLNSPSSDGPNNGGSLPRSGTSESANIFGSRSKSPPAYDTSNDTPHLMLSPIEENDGSPYSTSSTSRSSRSSNYPTTTSIFGGKPSPPPPKDDLPLPPIPGAIDESASKFSHSKYKYPKIGEVSDHSSGLEIPEGGLGEGEEPYMTIAEVNESKADLGLATKDEIGTQTSVDMDSVMPLKVTKFPYTTINEEKESVEAGRTLLHSEDERMSWNDNIQKVNNTDNRLTDSKVPMTVKFIDSQIASRLAQPHPINLSRSSSFDKSTNTEDSFPPQSDELGFANLNHSDISEDRSNASQNVQNPSVIPSGTGNLKTVSATPKAGEPKAGEDVKGCEVFV